MQPRLLRSRTEKILGGVCGGLGDYFNIDPVLVRLIFVLATLTTGLGFIAYPILWFAMPQAPARPQPPQIPTGQDAYVMHGQPQQQRQQVAQGRRGIYQAPPEPYNFDPHTGQPIAGPPPADGQTIQLDGDEAQGYGYGPTPQRRNRNWWGFVLVGLGVIALANALDLPTEIIFPVLLIVGGAVLLLRKR